MAVKRRGKKDNRTGKMCISIILIAFMAVMTVQIVKTHQKAQEYIEKQAQYEAELEAEQDRQLMLEQYEKDMQSRSARENIARSKLGLVYENEIVFKEQP